MENLPIWLPWAFIAAAGFFALGWLGARMDVKRLLTESRVLPQSYFKGLNFLLNEQPDKALEALIETGHQHPEAVELQFALGSLFRRRGEVDRALRVHKELSERGGLSAEQRTAIRSSRVEGLSFGALAKQYGVSRAAIQRVEKRLD